MINIPISFQHILSRFVFPLLWKRGLYILPLTISLTSKTFSLASSCSAVVGTLASEANPLTLQWGSLLELISCETPSYLI